MAAGGLSFFLSCARARMRSRPSSMGWSSASGSAALRAFALVVCLSSFHACVCVRVAPAAADHRHRAVGCARRLCVGAHRGAAAAAVKTTVPLPGAAPADSGGAAVGFDFSLRL
jgi:hypothetical protein